MVQVFEVTIAAGEDTSQVESYWESNSPKDGKTAVSTFSGGATTVSVCSCFDGHCTVSQAAHGRPASSPMSGKQPPPKTLALCLSEPFDVDTQNYLYIADVVLRGEALDDIMI